MVQGCCKDGLPCAMECGRCHGLATIPTTERRRRRRLVPGACAAPCGVRLAAGLGARDRPGAADLVQRGSLAPAGERVAEGLPG